MQKTMIAIQQQTKPTNSFSDSKFNNQSYLTRGWTNKASVELTNDPAVRTHSTGCHLCRLHEVCSSPFEHLSEHFGIQNHSNLRQQLGHLYCFCRSVEKNKYHATYCYNLLQKYLSLTLVHSANVLVLRRVFAPYP